MIPTLIRVLSGHLKANVERMYEKRNPYSLLLRVQINMTSVEINLQFSQEIKKNYHGTPLFPGHTYSEHSTSTNRDSYISVLTAALLKIARKCNQHRWKPANGSIMKIQRDCY